MDDVQIRRWDTAPFTSPEFHDGTVAVLRAGYLVVEVRRDGEALLRRGDLVLRTPEEFRAAFPGGDLPEEEGDAEWVFNAWFDAYLPGEDGDADEHLDMVDTTVDGVLEQVERWLHRNASDQGRGRRIAGGG